MAGRMMVRFSPALWRDLKVIREFLFHRMYRAPDVVEMRAEVTQVVDDLFPLFMSDTELLPKQWRKDVADATARDRACADRGRLHLGNDRPVCIAGTCTADRVGRIDQNEGSSWRLKH